MWLRSTWLPLALRRPPSWPAAPEGDERAASAAVLLRVRVGLTGSSPARPRAPADGLGLVGREKDGVGGTLGLEGTTGDGRDKAACGLVAGCGEGETGPWGEPRGEPRGEAAAAAAGELSALRLWVVAGAGERERVRALAERAEVVREVGMPRKVPDLDGEGASCAAADKGESAGASGSTGESTVMEGEATARSGASRSRAVGAARRRSKGAGQASARCLRESYRATQSHAHMVAVVHRSWFEEERRRGVASRPRAHAATTTRDPSPSAPAISPATAREDPSRSRSRAHAALVQPRHPLRAKLGDTASQERRCTARFVAARRSSSSCAHTTYRRL